MSRAIAPVLAVFVWVALAPRSATAQDEFLISTKYSKDADSTTLATSVELHRVDTVPGTPHLTMAPVIALDVKFPGNGLAGTPSPIKLALGFYYSAPAPGGRQLTFSVDGIPQTPLRADWVCMRSTKNSNANAFVAFVTPLALQRLAAAKRLDIRAGEQQFASTEDGLASLRAFATRVPSGSSVGAAGLDTTPYRAPVMWEFEVERPVLAQPGNPAPRYPSNAMVNHISGEVLVQVVVDTAGLPVLSTFRVLKSTDVAFTNAVRTVIPAYRFKPAQACERTVEQFVVMPFKFIAR